MRRAAAVFANPSSPHAAGRAARSLLENAREEILSKLGGRVSGPGRDRLVFTSGATEANQMAVAGLSGACLGKPRLFHSARDHAGTGSEIASLANTSPSVEPQPLQGTGQPAHSRSLTELPLDAHGCLDRDRLSLAGDASSQAVLSTTWGCSQSGTIDDIADLASRFPQMLIHTDAVQAVGRLPVDFSALGVASLSLAAHKLGGPRGIGGLLLRGDTAIEPLIPGTQERGLRGGTESVTLAVGFATAVRLATDRQAAEARRLAGLRDRLEQAVLAAGVEAVVIGGDAPRLPQMSVIAFPGRDRQAVVMAADLAGLCLASGTACASGSSEPSPALVAAGLPDAWVQSAVRVSLGWSTTDDDIERGIDLLRSVVGFRKP